MYSHLETLCIVLVSSTWCREEQTKTGEIDAPPKSFGARAVDTSVETSLEYQHHSNALHVRLSVSNAILLHTMK